MPRDPWQHRSENMRCSTCMFFVPKGSAPTAGPSSHVASLGRCRRNAPTFSGYPAVFAEDWCGEHRLASFTPIEKGTGDPFEYPAPESGPIAIVRATTGDAGGGPEKPYRKGRRKKGGR